MIDKILASPKGKPCSCPPGKICTACTARKKNRSFLKRQLFVEEPKRIRSPIIVNYFKQKPVPIQNLINRRSRWKSRKKQHESKPQRLFAVCRWYKRRKALKQLIKENEKENKREKERRRKEYENERIKDIIRWEHLKQQAKIEKHEPKLREEKKKEVAVKEVKYEPTFYSSPKKKKDVYIKEITYTKPEPSSIPKQKKVKKKKTYIKERSATAKPQSVAKQVSVKKYIHKDTITHRFVNCCYRICCQFYCCVSCVLIIVFVVMFIL